MTIDPTVLQGWLNLLLSPGGIGFVIYMIFRSFNQKNADGTDSAISGLSNPVKLLIVFAACEIWAFASAIAVSIPSPISGEWILTTAFTGVAVLVSTQASYGLLEKLIPAIGDILAFLKTGVVPPDPTLPPNGGAAARARSWDKLVSDAAKGDAERTAYPPPIVESVSPTADSAG